MTLEDTVVLSCHSLSKHYQQAGERIEVLSAIELQISAAERTAIIGGSGTGKTTLLNLLAGLDQASSGEIRIDGCVLQAMNDRQLSELRNCKLGFVYQFHHLLAEFSAVENVAMPLIIGGCSRTAAQRQAADLLGEVGLSARLEHKPAALSGGERQRVAIARALVNNPRCVLMDEPTGNLDRHSAAAIQQLIDRLARERQTAFVIVSHDPHLAEQMDAVYQLESARLERLR